MSEKKSIHALTLHRVNKMPEKDMKRLINTLFDVDGNLNRDVEYFEKHGMKKLGAGVYGTVYEFVGEDGYEYAVKISVGGTNDYTNLHDGIILEKLQGIKGYNKLFFYLDGYIEEDRWGIEIHSFFIMVTKKVKGFTIGKVTDNNDKDGSCIKQFIENARKDIIEVFACSISKAHNKNLYPDDIHQNNVMFDVESKIAVIVDVGNFKKLSDNINQSNDEISNRIKHAIANSEIVDICSKASNTNHIPIAYKYFDKKVG